MNTTTRLHAWWQQADPRTPVVGAIAAIVFLLHGFDGLLSRDLAIYSYAGQRVADGVPPYLGILNRAGPLAHMIPAVGVLGARAAGFDELLGIRLLFLALSVACVCAVYLVARNLFASPLAGLAAAAALLSFSGFIEYASNGPREKTAMVLFLLCALLAVLKQRWFTAGLFVCLATLVLQIAFPAGLTAMVVALVGVRRGGRIRALVRIAAGGLTPVAVLLVYFAAVGTVRESLDAFLLINAGYSIANLLTADLAENWSQLQGGYGVSLWVIVVGLAALVLRSLWALRRGLPGSPSTVPTVAHGAAGLVAIAWTLRDFDDWPDAFLVLPFAAIGIGALAKTVTELVRPGAAMVLTAVWLIVAVAVAGHYSVTERDHRLAVQRRVVAAMFSHLPPDASLLSVNAPHALVISGKTNPTRHQTFTSGLDRYVDDTWPGGLQGFGESVAQEQPTVITHTRRMPSWLAGTIEEEYQRMGRAPGWTWYVHRSVGPDVLAAMRRDKALRYSR